MLLLLAGFAAAADPEIDYLLSAVEQSGCTFIRNGAFHSAADAADHLRMKYKRARRHVDSAEEFIDRIASQSSLSGEPYTIECAGSGVQPSRSWLTATLARFRSTR